MNPIKLKSWEVHKFPWGSAAKKRNGSWTHVFIGNQTLVVEGIKIELSDHGIEFL